MRIIAGKYRGRKLKGPGARNKHTRPMLDRVRESLFSILSSQVEGVKVLDLCSGTGSIGLEALSRGARHVTFIERSSQNVRTIHSNIEILSVQDQTKVISGTLPRILKVASSGYGLVLFDPPFAIELADEVVPHLHELGLLSEHALLVIERSKLSKDLEFKHFKHVRKKVIGDSVLWIFEYIVESSEK